MPRPPANGGLTVQTSREMSLWRSKRMQEVRGIIEEAAGVDVTVLITGETGTGKDVVARAIHALSSRRRDRTSRSTARPSRASSSKASSSATSAAPSPGPTS